MTPGDVPNLIDELPILFIASCFAEGTSSFIHIEELKHKESDRLKAMQDGLDKMKIKNFWMAMFFISKVWAKTTNHQIF